MTIWRFCALYFHVMALMATSEGLIAEQTNLLQISLVLLTDTGRSRLHSS